MPAGKVPTSNITALYNNTTAGTDADPAAVDNAVQDIVQTINDNFDKQVGDISGHASNAVLSHPDKSVTRAKLADKVVGAGQLDDAAVGQSHHQDNGIPSRALPDNVILQRHMSDNSVGSAEIQAGAVQRTHLGSGVVGSGQLDPALLQNYGDIAVQAEFDKREFSVEKYAAQVVNGDWTQAIQSAIDYVSSIGGGVVRLMNAIYTITKIAPKSNVTLKGSGWGTVLKQPANVGAFLNPIEVNNAVNVRICNLTVDGNRANQTANNLHGIYLLTCNNVIVNDVYIKDVAGDGLYIGNVGYLAQNVDIRNVKIENSSRNEMVIVNIKNLTAKKIEIISNDASSASIDIEQHDNTDTFENITLEDVTGTFNGQPMKLIGMTTTVNPAKDVTLRNFTLSGTNGLIKGSNFDNVTILNSSGTHVEAAGCRNWTVNDFKTNGTASTIGVYVYPLNGVNPENINTINCKLLGKTSDGIIYDTVKGGVIRDTLSANNTNAGLYLLGACEDLSISDNKFTDTRAVGAKVQDYGVRSSLVTNHKRLSFSGNKLDGNELGEYSVFAVHPQVKSTIADVTYYLDGTAGNDGTDGLSAGAGAFKTWARLEQALPQIINHAVTIAVAAASYNVLLSLNGRTGRGSINMTGSSVKDFTRFFKNMNFDNNTCRISINGIGCQTGANSAVVTRCTYVEFNTCILDASAKSGMGVRSLEGSTVYVNDCQINNCTNAIYANKARIITNALSGVTNNFAFFAENGGTVSRMDATAPTATTVSSVLTGGLLVNASGGTIGT